MRTYNIIGRVKSHEVDAETKEFTELASKGLAIKTLSYYQNELSRLNLKVYEPERFKIEKPTEEQISNELKNIAEHKYYKLFGNSKTQIEKFVSENHDSVLEKREKAWNEIKDFFEMIESDKEDIENEKFQKEYDKEYKKQEDYIIGETEYVEAALDKIFNNIKLPLDTVVEIDYKKEKQKAIINIEVPTHINIPTVKTSISAIYGRVSVKNKLVREIDDEKSKCIIGLAYYICSLVFSASANIIDIDITIWENEKEFGLMWAYVSRHQFTNPKRFTPLVDIYNWNHISNIRLMRGGTHIEPTISELFKNQIQKKRDIGSISNSTM